MSAVPVPALVGGHYSLATRDVSGSFGPGLLSDARRGIRATTSRAELSCRCRISMKIYNASILPDRYSDSFILRSGTDTTLGR